MVVLGLLPIAPSHVCGSVCPFYHIHLIFSVLFFFLIYTTNTFSFPFFPLQKSTVDIQSEIPLKLTYQLQQKVPRQARYPGDRLPSIDEFPILNQEHASRVIHAKFVKFCGDDEVCQSRLKVTPVFDLRTGECGRADEVVGLVNIKGSVDRGKR